jgi:hypothetical protein
VNKERIVMGNSARVEELVGTEAIDELHKPDASESDPEDEGDQEDDEDDEDGDEDEDEDE